MVSGHTLDDALDCSTALSMCAATIRLDGGSRVNQSACPSDFHTLCASPLCKSTPFSRGASSLPRSGTQVCNWRTGRAGGRVGVKRRVRFIGFRTMALISSQNWRKRHNNRMKRNALLGLLIFFGRVGAVHHEQINASTMAVGCRQVHGSEALHGVQVGVRVCGAEEDES